MWVCINTRIAWRICVWLSTRIACLYLKQPKRPLCRCGKSTGIQVLGGNEHEKNSVLWVQPGYRLRGAGYGGWDAALHRLHRRGERSSKQYVPAVELDYLIYNDPVAYANLILNGDPDLYLKAVAKKTQLDWQREFARSSIQKMCSWRIFSFSLKRLWVEFFTKMW